MRGTASYSRYITMRCRPRALRRQVSMTGEICSMGAGHVARGSLCGRYVAGPAPGSAAESKPVHCHRFAIC